MASRQFNRLFRAEASSSLISVQAGQNPIAFTTLAIRRSLSSSSTIPCAGEASCRQPNHARTSNGTRDAGRQPAQETTPRAVCGRPVCLALKSSVASSRRPSIPQSLMTIVPDAEVDSQPKPSPIHRPGCVPGIRSLSVCRTESSLPESPIAGRPSRDTPHGVPRFAPPRGDAERPSRASRSCETNPKHAVPIPRNEPKPRRADPAERTQIPTLIVRNEPELRARRDGKRRRGSLRINSAERTQFSGGSHDSEMGYTNSKFSAGSCPYPRPIPAKRTRSRPRDLCETNRTGDAPAIRN